MPERLGRRARDPASLLVLAMFASAALLLVWGSKLTFLLDDWEFLVYRTGFTADTILSPHGEHISIAPILIYKGLLETAGMSSSVPYLAVSVALFLTSACLLFVYLRRCVDPWLALLAAGIVLFLGPAFDDLLWDFQMGVNGSLACGLGALVTLERGDRRGDVTACVLLSLGMTFSSLELPFVVAAAVDVWLRPDRLRRLYVVAVPAALYVVWWVGWGHEAETAVSLHNAASTPQFVFDAASAALASLLGLVKFGQEPGPGGLDWGRPLLIVALGLGGWRIYRMGRVPRELWIAIALAGTFWGLAGLNEKPGRAPTDSRYLLPGAIFILMIAAELLRGVRVSRLVIVAAYVVGATAVASNLYVLRDAYIAYRNTSDLIKADLGALEIARSRIVFPVTLDEAIADTGYVHISSGAFFSAADKYGSPADSPVEIAAAPEPPRVGADKVLARALGVNFAPVQTSPRPAGPAPRLVGQPGTDARAEGSCLVVGPPGAILRLPPGGASVQASPRAPAAVALRRFATASFPLGTVPLGQGQAGVARIPTDIAAQPWELALRSRDPVTVCGIGVGGPPS